MSVVYDVSVETIHESEDPLYNLQQNSIDKGRENRCLDRKNHQDKYNL